MKDPLKVVKDPLKIEKVPLKIGKVLLRIGKVRPKIVRVVQKIAKGALRIKKNNAIKRKRKDQSQKIELKPVKKEKMKKTLKGVSETRVIERRNEAAVEIKTRTKTEEENRINLWKNLWYGKTSSVVFFFFRLGTNLQFCIILKSFYSTSKFAVVNYLQP